MKEIIKNICFITLVLSFTQCKNNDKDKQHLYGQHNAVWTESIYLRGYQPTTFEKLTPKHTRRYGETLKKYNVKYAYLFAGPYGVDGHLPDYSFSETAINSIKFLKENYPEIVILPWIGGIQNKQVYLEDSTWVSNALADTKKLIETHGVPGVHVDLEYILQGDPFLEKDIGKEKPGDLENYANNVNSFHEKLRHLLPEAFISSVVLATPPDTKPWKRKTTLEELKVLVQHIDQLSFLYYDTYIHDQKVFEENCSYLLNDIKTLKQTSDIQYLISIGTFVNVPELHKYRNLEIEAIPNSLKTIKKQAFLIDSTQQLVNGISIFSDWATDEKEWKQFYKHWAGLY